MSTNRYATTAEQFTESWFGGTKILSDQVPSTTLMPTVNVEKALDRYVDYLLDGLHVNQQLMANLVSSATDGGPGFAQAMAEAALGHTRAISTWLIDELQTVQPAF
jgi:hypothetical protein